MKETNTKRKNELSQSKKKKTAKKKAFDPVPVPEKALFKHLEDGRSYVYLNLGKFKKEGRKGYQYKRVMIGISSDGKMMIPNENYFKMVHIPRPAPDRSCTLRIGPALVIDKAARISELYECLEEHFGLEEAERLLDLAACAMFGSAQVHAFYNYEFFSALLSGKRLTEEDIDHLLQQTLNRQDISEFLADWMERKGEEEKIVILPDIALAQNLYLHPNRKDHQQEDFYGDDFCEGFALAVRKKDYLPLFYQSRALFGFDLIPEQMIEILEEHGCSQISVASHQEYLEAVEEAGIEKLFYQIEDLRPVGFDRVLHRFDQNFEACCFISFLACILQVEIESHLKELYKLNPQGWNWTAVRFELDKLMAEQNYPEESYRRRQALSGAQEIILSCLGLKEKDIDDFIKRL